MNFGSPDRLLILALLLPLAGLSFFAVRRALRRGKQLLGPQIPHLAPGFSVSRRLLRDGLLAGAVGALIFALAEPQVGTWIREVQQKGVDVMVVLDTSRSMLAQDVRPTRLERAKREVRGLLGQLQGNRIGLVTFAGDARRVTPLTHDPSTFRRFLDDVDVWTNGRGGTAVGEGVQLALDAFDPQYPAQRVIVLLTDGEDHMSDPPATDVAFRALAEEVPIHVVAFGEEGGTVLRIPDDRGVAQVVRDSEGDPVITRPNMALLESIASISRGAFLHANEAPFPLDEIWNKRIAVMEGVTRATSTREEGVNRFQWALMGALLFLGIRAFLQDGLIGRTPSLGELS